MSRLRDRLKPLYLHYHSAYGHQTWQVGHMVWHGHMVTGWSHPLVTWFW